jgi:hypothetical protein
MEGRTRYSRMSAERLARLVHQRVTSLAFRFACVCKVVPSSARREHYIDDALQTCPKLNMIHLACSDRQYESRDVLLSCTICMSCL